MSEFGRWCWSWPIDADALPVTVRTEDGFATLTTRGTIYDFAAHVGPGYSGTWVREPDDSPFGPITLEYKVGRNYLRQKLRSGAWAVVVDE